MYMVILSLDWFRIPVAPFSLILTEIPRVSGTSCFSSFAFFAALRETAFSTQRRKARQEDRRKEEKEQARIRDYYSNA